MKLCFISEEQPQKQMVHKCSMFLVKSCVVVNAELKEGAVHSSESLGAGAPVEPAYLW